MKWASALSEAQDSATAMSATTAELERQLGGVAPDLVVAFASPHHADAYAALPAQIAAAFPRALLFGCSAAGVIGAGHEVEERPALSLTAASLPGVTLRALAFGDAPGGDAPAAETVAQVGVAVEDDPQFLVICDPYTFDGDALVAGLDAAYPSGRKVGGLASGGRGPGQNALWSGERMQRVGAVGVAMSGDIAVDTIVAQGCRPIGDPMPVTRADGHVVRELGGKSPVAVMRAIYDGLDKRDKELFRHSLFVGLEMEEGRIEFRGDFLVRNIVGVDPNSGALAVAANVRQWQVIQFLLRDAKTAEQDLSERLERFRGPKPAGALLFSCMGRGQNLFGRADHDTDLFRARVGAVPLGGFFCNGEIGPVGGQTFLHGYTSAFGLFRGK
ncbi:MAG TPA: FIST N-terminal domain-containing protein [Polyangia bacterium]|jgi:small ligand-binding sensory domain FIST